MTDEQLEFFRRLCAPFEPAQIRSYAAAGRTLHYITSRTVMNRLDDVCGPAGWFPEYHVHANGVSCKLSIAVPGEDGQTRWMAKSDGGGFAGMNSADDNEKSGYTDAIKRAAMAWGIGRYLYRDGSPQYLGDQPPPSEAGRSQGGYAPPPRQAMPAQQSRAGTGYPAQPQGRPPTAPPWKPPHAPQAPAPQGNGNFPWDPPTDNPRAMYPWLKRCEEVFGTGVVKMADEYAKACGYPYKTNEWSDEQRTDVAWSVVEALKQWPSYGGEFEDLEDPRGNPQ